MKKNKGHYLARFRHNIAINDHGVPGECMTWCEKNCTGKWGWFYESTNPNVGDFFQDWNYQDQEAYMTFTHKKDAVRFWFANIKSMSEQNR